MGDGYAVKLSPLYFTFTYEKRVHQVFCPAEPMVFPLFFCKERYTLGCLGKNWNKIFGQQESNNH